MPSLVSPREGGTACACTREKERLRDTCNALIESPPSRTKSERRPTFGTPIALHQAAATAHSSGSSGSAPPIVFPPFAFPFELLCAVIHSRSIGRNATRSSLPVGVSGIVSSTITSLGQTAAGSHLLQWSKSVVVTASRSNTIRPSSSSSSFVPEQRHVGSTAARSLPSITRAAA